MRRWYDEEHGMKMCEPDCVDEWLFDIWGIGCDYDGCHTAKDLKKLIDELVGMANKARECLWKRRLFGDHGEPKPQTNADRIRAMSDEELAELLCSIAYARNTPWSEPFATKFCKSCPTVEATIKETGKTMGLKECDFVDGLCPHGSDAVWWLRQPVKDGEW